MKARYLLRKQNYHLRGGSRFYMTMKSPRQVQTLPVKLNAEILTITEKSLNFMRSKVQKVNA